MHRIEINVCVLWRARVEKKRMKKRREKKEQTEHRSKNIYNFTLGAVMDFRVYFEPIMLPLKVSCGST